MPGVGRRENWDETVDRYRNYFLDRVPQNLREQFDRAIEAIRAFEVMPSMRCLWSAGDALDNDNVAAYNCAYTHVDSPRTFSEILYILMNGAGVGFSTERQFITNLPEVPSFIERRDVNHVVKDSKLGWAEGYDTLINSLYAGYVPHLDLSEIRPRGMPLKTFGGRASGPAPLLQLIKFTVKTFLVARGRKLNSLEVYDLICMIANCVVSGGVRRSSTINLSNLSDTRMRDAKTGQFYIEHPQRMLSNNSVAYTEKPDMRIFMEEWMHLMKNGSGERGIINRESLMASARRTGREDRQFGTNPCGEIILRSKQFCNLTEAIVRPDDTIETLTEKVRHATLLGVLQSGLTEFNYISPEWKKNCEEERLLGVSLTGLMDNLKVWDGLGGLKHVAQDYSVQVAREFGYTIPKAVTCVKPSGTVSQLADCASGIHPRFSSYFIRRVRVASTDPVAKLLQDQGVPCQPEVGQDIETANTLVFEFPLKSPQDSILRHHLSALGQLEGWLKVKRKWCDHNPSCTIYVKEHEWMEVGAWVYKHWDDIGGLSFLPFDGGIYQLAPYEEITELEFNTKQATFPAIDWNLLAKYESKDYTEGSRTYACTGDRCEL
jgi:ribonucleoside-diphosphate reductase alpha chain